MEDNICNFFDVHSHILPGVDDGARDMEETRQMLLRAYEEGTRIIVATPHYAAGKKHMASENLLRLLLEVNQTAAEISKELLVISGNELFYSLDMLDALVAREALTLHGSRYILVEFLPSEEYKRIREGLNRCLFAGYLPILAHAERYKSLLNDPELVGELVVLGAYIQLNLSAFTGNRFSTLSKFCHRLITEGWVHFLGSDSHRVDERPSGPREAYTILCKRYGKEIAGELYWDNPMSLLMNKQDNLKRQGAERWIR